MHSSTIEYISIVICYSLFSRFILLGTQNALWWLPKSPKIEELGFFVAALASHTVLIINHYPGSVSLETILSAFSL